MEEMNSKELREGGKRSVAQRVFAELEKKKSAAGSNGGISETLECIVDDILDSEKLIDDTDNIDWCRWLIAGGRTPGEFVAQGENFNIFFLTLKFFKCQVQSL